MKWLLPLLLAGCSSLSGIGGDTKVVVGLTDEAVGEASAHKITLSPELEAFREEDAHYVAAHELKHWLSRSGQKGHTTDPKCFSCGGVPYPSPQIPCPSDIAAVNPGTYRLRLLIDSKIFPRTHAAFLRAVKTWNQALAGRATIIVEGD